MTAVYRVQQGLRALFAFSQPVAYDLAEQHLDAAQMGLFKRMTRSEQLHSLNVLRTVLAQATNTPDDLALAALLHDVGKSHYALAVWQRTIAVLVAKLIPALARRLSQNVTPERLTFWQAPFAVRQHHPAWGGQLVAHTDASERALWLIEHHADALTEWASHPYADLLARLKQADDTN